MTIKDQKTVRIIVKVSGDVYDYKRSENTVRIIVEVSGDVYDDNGSENTVLSLYNPVSYFLDFRTVNENEVSRPKQNERNRKTRVLRNSLEKVPGFIFWRGEVQTDEATEVGKRKGCLYIKTVKDGSGWKQLSAQVLMC